MSAEKVLVFSSECLARFDKKFKNGLCSGWQDAHDVLGGILDADLQFIARAFAEKSPQFRQIIPYCVFLSGEWPNAKVFTYRRSPKGGEGRLHGKRSLGVGGHINPIDGATGFTAVYKGVERELLEEVNYCPPGPQQWFQVPLAIIADDRDEVGKVHCGIVYLFKVEESNIQVADLALASAEWLPLTSLAQEKNDFEGWSQLVIDALEQEGVTTEADVDLAEEGYEDVDTDSSTF